MLKNDDENINLINERIQLSMEGILQQFDGIDILNSSFFSIKQILSEFTVLLSNRFLNNEPVSMTDAPFLKSFIANLANFTFFLSKISSESFFDYIKTNTIKDIFITTNLFCNEFNKFSIHFHISDFPPFVQNPFVLQDLYDLTQIITNSNLNESQQSAKINELMSIINYFIHKEEEEKNKESRNRTILTTNEIHNSLSHLFFWIIKNTDCLLQKKIGYGSYSTVFLGQQISTNRTFSIKKIHSNQVTQPIFDSFKNEIEILSSIDHTSIISFQGFSISPSLLIFTENMAHGNLYNWLRNSPNRSNPTKLSIIALGAAYGLSYLHSKKIIHHDIKSSNILLDENDYPKICDFGISEIKDRNNIFVEFDFLNTVNIGQSPANDAISGTIRWMAPEILSHQTYTEKSDVYSYGVLLWELITKTIPFQKMNDYQIVNQVVYEKLRPPIPDDTSPSLKSVLERCFDENPNNRPSFNDIVKSFEQGEIEFTGSDRGVIENYIYLSNNSYNDLSKAIILTDLKNKSVLGLHKLKIALTNKNNFLGNDIIDELIKLTKNCNSNQVSSELIQILSVILKNQNYLTYYSNNGGTEAFYKMLVSHTTSTMNHAIEVCQTLFDHSHLMPNIKQLEKLAMFITDGEIEAVRFFKTLLLFNQNIPEIVSIFTNVSYKGKQNELVIEIFDFLSDQLIKYNNVEQLKLIFNCIVSLVDNSNVALNCTVKVIVRILEFAPPSPSFVSSFVSSLFSRFVSSKEEIPALSILLLIIKKKCRFDFQDIQIPFSECLKSASDKIVICSLKILYVYLNNNPNQISLICGFNLIELLSSENLTISSLAAANILTLLNIAANCFDIEKNQLIFLNYLQRHLNPQNDNYNKKYSLIALKFGGFVISDVNMIMLCEENHIFDFVGLYLDVSNDLSSEKHQEIALTIFASVSYTYPILPSLLTQIDFIISIYTQKETFQEVILTFLANISICPDAAKLIANHLLELSLQLKENPIENQYRILFCIFHVSQNPSMIELFTNECISNIIEYTKDKWDVPNFDILFNLYHFISKLEYGKYILKAMHFDKFVQSKLACCSQQLRITFLQIVSNLK